MDNMKAQYSFQQDKPEIEIASISLPANCDDNQQESYVWREIECSDVEEIKYITTCFIAWVGLLLYNGSPSFQIVHFGEGRLYLEAFDFSPTYSFREFCEHNQELPHQNFKIEQRSLPNDLIFIVRDDSRLIAENTIRSLKGAIGIVEILSSNKSHVFLTIRATSSDGYEGSLIDSFLVFYQQTKLLSDTMMGSLALSKQFIPNAKGPIGSVKHPTFISEFRTRVGEHPDNLAVMHADNYLSYGELHSASDRMAKILQNKSVRKASRVGVLLKRSHWVPISILAILKLGAIYVPLPSSGPIDRVKYIVQDAGIDVIITSEENKSLFPLLPDTELVFINDEILIKELDGKVSLTPTSIYDDDIVYIIYTSGTTGKPKGVGIPNKALASFLNWQTSIYNASTADIFLQIAPITFDFSIGELFIPLVTGATLAIPDEELSQDPLALSKYLFHKKITIAHFVPTVLRYLLEIMNKEFENLQQTFSGPYLKHVICNGEPLPDVLRRRFYRIFPEAHLHNCYGPTEATVAVTHYLCVPEDEERTMYIGRPGPDIELYILNHQKQLLPKGIIGELYIGGQQLATGYINNPELTSEKFVGIEKGGYLSRLYKTGDFVRIGCSGNIEFIGRNDRQVKIRGMRVEIGEIESTILNQPNVEHCVVFIDKEADNSIPRVLAFVVPSSLQVKELLENIRASLPEYMIPNMIVPLKALPLTINGKLDKNTLLQIALENQENMPSKTPRTLTPELLSQEHLLIQIVEKVTGRKIDKDTNLSNIGLDSLAFLELQLLASEQGYLIPIELFRQNPTIRSLVKVLPRKPSQNAKRDSEEFMREFDAAFEWALEDKPEVLVVHSSLVHLEIPNIALLKSRLLEIIARGTKQDITFAFPAFNFKFCWTKKFHYKDTPSETGIVATWLQDMPKALRTPHPFYSFVVVGKHASDLAQCANTTPFGDDSYFGWFEKFNARIFTLGTKAITQYHRCEYLANVPYHKYEFISGDVNYGSGWILSGGMVYKRDLETYPQRDLFAGDVEKTCEVLGPAFRSHPLGTTYVHYVTCREMREKITPILVQDPFALLVHGEEVRKMLLEKGPSL